MKRSIWALVAGILVAIGATTLIDVVLHVAGVFPPLDRPINDLQAALATSYRIVTSVAGAWLTARLAPSKPMTHVLILCGLGVVVGLITLLATWNMGLGPRWYPVALMVLAIPQAWAGGKIYESQSRSPTGAS